jgi:tetratricopeptide (TPR) repeat protein
MTGVFVLVFALHGSICFGQVHVWEEKLTIPTWLIGPPEVNPTFSWSSSRPEVYPYAYQETLTNRLSDKDYEACWLENEYIKALVLPDIGGRLHGAVDKTNGYNFFYWQPTIKPALVGMTGAWVSGGIEWNFPHGHRPTGFSRVQHRLVENADGSKTVWVGEPELVHRMRWIVGLTVYPGKSVIEAKVRLMNTSPVRHSFQMWTTTAVNANENYQAIFPTRAMTGHEKLEYFHWPVDKGVDISWWKNVPNAASFFALETGAFFGGYDHGKRAGTVITGNPHIVNGKKFWTWGTSPSGRIWEPILTDGQGPYLEPQAGAYSDNQPDYHWIEPGEIKAYSHYFFPVRDIGPFKTANVNGALNLEVKDSVVEIGAYSTQSLKAAEVVLKLGSDTLLSRVIDIDPAKPFIDSLEFPSNGSIADLRLTMSSASGAELITYSPEIVEPAELPEPRNVPGEPAEIATLDELWHTGDQAYKFRDFQRGRAYFEEVLSRERGDSRSNISLAELDIKQARYRTALDHLSTAAERDPDNGSIFYLRGIAQESLGDYAAAHLSYYRATHFVHQLSRAYGRLALLALRSGEPHKAAEHATKAIEQNVLNPRLWTFKAMALRKLHRVGEALELSRHALELDPVNAWAAFEHFLALQASGEPAGGAGIQAAGLLHNTQTTVEASLNYANAGQYADAFTLLDSVPTGPLGNYYKGYFKDRLGDRDAAAQWFAEGREQSAKGSFAFRLEGIDVFNTALSYEPGDGKAHYYLGLIYGKISDVDRAIEHWKQAVQLDPDNSLAWRNLGLAHVNEKGDMEKGLEYYTQAFILAPDDSRVLLELDTVKASLDVSSHQRLAFLNQNLETVSSRDALVSNLVDLLLAEKSYAEAIQYLENHHFNSWEGAYGIHNAYVEAYTGLAEQSEDPREALDYYRLATEYPRNLEVAPRDPNLRGFLFYPVALLHRQLGDNSRANGLLEITAGEASERPTLGSYFQALALTELGNSEEANHQLDGLNEEAESLITNGSEHYRGYSDDDQRAIGHFYRSLYWKAVGNPAKADDELKLAKSLMPAVEREALTIAQKTFAGSAQ